MTAFTKRSRGLRQQSWGVARMPASTKEPGLSPQQRADPGLSSSSLPPLAPGRTPRACNPCHLFWRRWGTQPRPEHQHGGGRAGGRPRGPHPAADRRGACLPVVCGPQGPVPLLTPAPHSPHSAHHGGSAPPCHNWPGAGTASGQHGLSAPGPGGVARAGSRGQHRGCGRAPGTLPRCVQAGRCVGQARGHTRRPSAHTAGACGCPAQ